MTSHLIRVRELEFPAVACPADEGLARLVGQELQEELPQLDWATACRTVGKETTCLERKVIFILIHTVTLAFFFKKNVPYNVTILTEIIVPSKGI